MKVSADPISLFRDQAVFVMGAGRSGTTILYTLIGSMKPVFGIFEPVLLRLMSYLLKEPNPQLEQAVLSTLFEDYFVHLLHGRHVNPHKESWTYSRNHELVDDMMWRAKVFKSRSGVIAWAMVEKPIWLIKLPEFQVFAPIAARMLPSARFIHIIRNGNDVVISAVSRDWYTDNWLKHFAVEWLIDGCPWYMPEDVRSEWQGWNPETRAACVWRVTTEAGTKFCANNQNCMEFRYEDFCQKPRFFTDALRLFLNVRQTILTQGHINDVSKWKATEYDSVVDKIVEPERVKFMKLTKSLGYKI